MTDFDPFAAALAAEAPASNNIETKEKPVADATNDSKITVTLKGGSGFDAPWIVLHGSDAAELNEQLTDENLKALIDQTQKVGQYFAGLGKSTGGRPSGGGGAAAPAGQPGQPAGSTGPRPTDPPCPDGWTYKEGVGKTGKTWRAFMPPRGSNEQPQWLR